METWRNIEEIPRQRPSQFTKVNKIFIKQIIKQTSFFQKVSALIN